jgi:hypothetical protein
VSWVRVCSVRVVSEDLKGKWCGFGSEGLGFRASDLGFRVLRA